ncbi:MAG: hypothetical protein LBD82_02645, partial [Deltaproteobacteria bacterium]|nr:hypothetical protein [Deltaproteobacteria bacterium]
MSDADKFETGERRARFVTLHIRLTRLLAAIFVLALGFIICFWMGVLTGENNAQLNALIPPPAASPSPQSDKTDEVDETAAARHPLQPEDLSFQDKLRQSAPLAEENLRPPAPP